MEEEQNPASTSHTSTEQLQQDTAKLEHQYGCEHYRRRCKIRAPCCNQIFSCRHCHNEATSSLSNPKDRHEIVRHDIKQVICSVCNTEQVVAQVCNKCGVKMGEYFCDICKFYDDDTSKQQFHCDGCGICRLGGRENFFHCEKCGSCYQIDLRDNHSCVENSMKNYCPVCYEYLFDSVKQVTGMKCGHTMHMDCFHEMAKQQLYRCPICSKTVMNTSEYWQMLDEEFGLESQSLAGWLVHILLSGSGIFFLACSCVCCVEIEAVQMPEQYRYEVSILCNDCNSTSKVAFHVVGHKCKQCASFNTRRIARTS